MAFDIEQKRSELNKLELLTGAVIEQIEKSFESENKKISEQQERCEQLQQTIDAVRNVLCKE